ncbi:hypothetical protein F2P81_007935 [Scophthalmus maximus]|uniref:Uncharacterized protein n=1 Tax=Scophthalmus maximus TaxID=52904 RepID=A0A6A4T6U7_SCOMX|nr:hypothetical protein F2P81_007935 [Scophthalmus maximus]
MKTPSLVFLLLLASGACDDVKYISKRNSGPTVYTVTFIDLSVGADIEATFTHKVTVCLNKRWVVEKYVFS